MVSRSPRGRAQAGDGKKGADGDVCGPLRTEGAREESTASLAWAPPSPPGCTCSVRTGLLPMRQNETPPLQLRMRRTFPTSSQLFFSLPNHVTPARCEARAARDGSGRGGGAAGLRAAPRAPRPALAPAAAPGALPGLRHRDAGGRRRLGTEPGQALPAPACPAPACRGRPLGAEGARVPHPPPARPLTSPRAGPAAPPA